MAENYLQNLNHGISLLNLLALYPAASNAAVVAAIDQILNEESLRLAVQDLKKFETNLLSLPDGEANEITLQNFNELPGGPLRDLLRRLARLNTLYEGKKNGQRTTSVQKLLTQEPFADLHTLQVAIANLHQIKSGS